ncbi:MAG: hypothetical protein IKF71_05015 [Bacilli bacterium]|nr:hypothetical protein [Bacilli bacterium]
MFKKINKKIVFQYTFLFFFFLFWNLWINVLQNDEIWNYGFAHNLYSGLIPYKDFNMVITPFYPFLMSLIFHMLGSSLLVFHIENAIVLCGILWLLYRLIKEKIYIAVLFLMLFSNSLTSPGYNIFLLFLLYFILYLEKKKANDYVIGFIIGLSFLTKQSVGFFFLLPSLFYCKKDIKKCWKRVVGFIIPCLIFFLYLIITKSLNSFLDLCLFGLFDFGEKNGSMHIIGIIFFILYLVICVCLIRKNKKNINHYYVLAFVSMMIPLFDFYHCAMAYFVLLTHFLSQYPIKIKIPFHVILYVSTLGIGCIMFFTYHEGYKIIYPNKIPHFEYRLIREDSIAFTEDVIGYLKDHPENNYTFVVSGGYYFRLATNTKMSYLDMINYGNFGYHENEKIIKKIQEKKDTIFIVSKEDLSSSCQANKEAVRYIMKNGKKMHSIQFYDFYVLNETIKE